MSEEQYNRNFEPNEIPEKIKLKVYVSYGLQGYCAKQVDVWTFDPSKSGTGERILLAMQEVEFTIPPHDKNEITGKAIEVLEDQKAKIQADFHMKLKGVQEQIDQLKAIEYKPGVENE